MNTSSAFRMGHRAGGTRVSKLVLMGASLVGVVIGVVVLGPPGRKVIWRATQPPVTSPFQKAVPRRLAEDVARPHLERAEERAKEAIQPHLEAAEKFFQQAKANSYELARAIVKGRSAKDMEAFVAQQFHAHGLAPEDLNQLANQILISFREELKSIDNQMLVDLRADLADLPESSLGKDWDPEQWKREYSETIALTLKKVEFDLSSELTRQLTSILAGEVLAQMATRMAVSAGVRGAGAAGGLASFGIGLVIGLIVDAIISDAFDSSMANELNTHITKYIEKVQAEFTPQLQQHLSQEAEVWAKNRRATVVQMLKKVL